MSERAETRRDDVAAAFRRAAVQHHHRIVADDLDASPDRAAIAAAFRGADRPTSVVVVRADGVTDTDRALLDQIATRLRSIVREPEAVHRVGVRFLMVLPGDRYLADRVARRVAAAFAAPFSVSGTDIVVRPAIGIADADPADPTAAVQRADLDAHRSLTGHRR